MDSVVLLPMLYVSIPVANAYSFLSSGKSYRLVVEFHTELSLTSCYL
jgi:hypothetical protein